MGLFVILGGPLTGLFGYGLSLVGWSGRPAFLLIPYASLWLITVWRWRHNWRKAAIVTVAALAGLAEMVLFFLWLAAQLADGA
ncbi:MAG: hypothetical protein H7338_16810 [Candidatus Sericytochromatia bacterium]|nr:hypothetical protein [Candidatus Sericytochromatia bacterium]